MANEGLGLLHADLSFLPLEEHLPEMIQSLKIRVGSVLLLNWEEIRSVI